MCSTLGEGRRKFLNNILATIDSDLTYQIVQDTTFSSAPEFAMQCFLISAKVRLSAIRHVMFDKIEPSWERFVQPTAKILRETIHMANLLLDTTSIEICEEIEIRKCKLDALFTEKTLWYLIFKFKTITEVVCESINEEGHVEELAMANLYQRLIDNERETDWISRMKKCRHLLNAALLTPTEDDRTQRLRKAKELAQYIWTNCPSCRVYPDFSSSIKGGIKSGKEAALLGEIMYHLDEVPISLGSGFVSDAYTKTGMFDPSNS
ncbi:MAG: hypothetical protein KR126chlam3_00836 [Chlamydiae bacterium]|nr:hypothetical protein [Chlamydiota bacterium]